jgi:hypothetical protein
MNMKNSHLLIGSVLLILVTAIFATTIATAQPSQAATTIVPASPLQSTPVPGTTHRKLNKKGIVHGIIQSIDTSTMSFTLQVSSRAKPPVNATPGTPPAPTSTTRVITIVTTPATKYIGTSGTSTGSFTDIQQGQYISVRVIRTKGVIIAIEIHTIPVRGTKSITPVQ